MPTIRETNRKLYDSNDGLRSALAGAAKRRVRPLTTGASHPPTQHEARTLKASSTLSFMCFDSCPPKTKSRRDV